MDKLAKFKIDRNSNIGSYSPKTFFLLWMFQLIVVVLTRLTVDDDFIFISVTSTWTALCFIMILFHHLYLIGDRNWMTLQIAFYLPYWLVFFLIPVRLIVQKGYQPRYQDIIASEYWPTVVFAASTGICCFLGGYSLIAQRKNQEKKELRKLPTRLEIMVIKVSAWILLLIAVVAFSGFMILGGSALYQDGYVHVLRLGWVVNVAYTVFETGFKGAAGLWTIYLLFYYKFRWHHFIAISCLGIMLIAMVLSGDRGLLAWLGICVLVIYSQRHPIKLSHILCFVLLGSMFFSVIQKVRPTGERTLTAYISATKDLDPFEGLTQYAESTASTVTNAFEVTQKKGYFHGTFLEQGALSIVPFYGKLFPWLPAIKDGRMDGTANYMTNYVFGYNKYGLGTTVVTDIYLDFGLMGVLVIMFFYGCFGGYLYNGRNRGRYHFGLLCYAFFVPAFMSSTRAAFTSSFRLLWTILLCYSIFIIADNLIRISRRNANRLEIQNGK